MEEHTTGRPSVDQILHSGPQRHQRPSQYRPFKTGISGASDTETRLGGAAVKRERPVACRQRSSVERGITLTSEPVSTRNLSLEFLSNTYNRRLREWPGSVVAFTAWRVLFPTGCVVDVWGIDTNGYIFWLYPHRFDGSSIQCHHVLMDSDAF
ncbi:unnamed protein product [Rodentolepis nana]|uniref:Uncharacterized protein n=1 Tax=Rodentolepis nana TaxID=102285 RepID=A0A0R3THJ9_RODNA|nr:unnamed protein product [Rodentolepis nana]